MQEKGEGAERKKGIRPCHSCTKFLLIIKAKISIDCLQGPTWSGSPCPSDLITLVHSTSITTAFLLSLEHDRQAPASGPLPVLFPLPGTFFPSPPTRLILSLSLLLKCLLSKTSPGHHINPTLTFGIPFPYFHFFSSLATYIIILYILCLFIIFVFQSY